MRSFGHRAGSPATPLGDPGFDPRPRDQPLMPVKLACNDPLIFNAKQPRFADPAFGQPLSQGRSPPI